MSKILLFILAVSIGLIGCDTEYELKQSVFIADPDYPGLPQYSEWGYNTFGAYYDRVPFTSDYEEAPAKVSVSGGTTTLSLYGNKGTGGESIELSITIPRFAPDDVSGLVALHEVEFDLTDEGIDVALSIDGMPTAIQVQEGFLRISRAQSLIVDGQFRQVIWSGRFEMKLLHHNTGVTLSDGRFDLGIGPDNFFLL